MKPKSIVATFLAALTATIIAVSPLHAAGTAGAKPIKLRFANLEYGDHSFSSIADAKGFFRDAGLDVTIGVIKVDEIINSMVTSKFEVVSVPPAILFSNHDTAPGLVSFVFSDLFVGYGLMARGDAGFKRYSDFVAAGMSHTDAVKATARQLKGKVFAYPEETAIKPFIDKLVADGGLTTSDFKSLILDDPLAVSAMRKGEANFQVGGVPSRLQLEKEGYVALITSNDLARGARASADSPELAAILQNGWATTRDFHDRNHEIILRLAGVNYRLMQFMREHEAEAIQIHMKYLSRITGQEFTEKDGKVIYHSLNPFFTFAEQATWFHDRNSPYYYAYVNGAILKSFTAKNAFRNRAPSVEDVIFADDTYYKLELLRAQTELAIRRLESQQPTAQQRSKIADARRHLSNFNFVDAALAVGVEIPGVK